MRKIFLTSGIALCIACPAFANSITSPDNQVYNATNGVVSNGCTESVLGVDDGTASLEAIWNANTTTVSYNCGTSNANPVVNGSWSRPSGWSGDTQTATYDAPFEHPTGGDVCSLSGYTFNSWNCVTGTDPNTVIANGGISSGNWVVNADNVTCTATWTPNTIGITWNEVGNLPDGNGVEFANNGGATCTYDSTITLPTAPTKTGYTFNGWVVQQAEPQNP